VEEAMNGEVDMVTLRKVFDALEASSLTMEPGATLSMSLSVSV
jgi:hypothetical protein